MATTYLERGALAGAVAGGAYGLFVALVADPFVAGLESVGSPHAHGHAGSGAVASELATTLVSVGGGVLWGLLFGVAVFGVGFYFLEPALPGSAVTGRLALAAAGFLTVSGAPWLVLPPKPPGVEQSLGTGTRTTWYAAAMVAGAAASVLAGLAHRKTVERGRAVRALATAAPLCLLAIPAVLAPTNHVHGDVPAGLAAAFRWTVVFGQVGLWATLAGVHARFGDTDAAAVEASEFPAPTD